MYKVSDLWLRDTLQAVYQRRTATRADIVHSTGLNAGSVSRALRLLLRNGTILKVGDLASSGGRRREVFTLNPEAAYFVGLDLEGHQISFALVNFAGDVRYRSEQDLDPSHPLDTHKLFDGIESLIATLDAHQLGRVIAIGISCPGLLTKDGRLSAVNLGWHGLPFASELKKVAEARNFGEPPIFIETDLKSCIFLEKWLGCAQQYENVVYISAERGIGAGILMGGKVMTGELGHLTIDPNSAERCKCGKQGCLETVALSSSIVRQYLKQTQQKANGKANRLQYADILKRARQGESAALAIMQRVGEAWGLALSYVVNLLNPEIIILGGDLVAAEDVLLPVIEKELVRHCLPELVQNVQMTVSSLGLDIRLKAAASLALRKALADSGLLKKICNPVLAPAKDQIPAGEERHQRFGKSGQEVTPHR